uniref:Uncharacterized protein n=1 Tax=Leersia perrieri TaxID=77586 RepID=A0A0D9XD30_9ORYZ
MASREGVGRTPSLRVGRTQEYKMGRETQLLAAEDDDGGSSTPVSLFVLCGDRFEAARLFRSGGLSVRMARVEGYPVSMASCVVGDHHWMLSRDALVARLDALVFVFEMPGFFYAVVVPPDAGGDRKCATLAEIFLRFCSYHDLSTTHQGEDETGDLTNQNSNPWVRAHARIQRLKKGPTSQPATAGDADGIASQLERAVRTSAVVKLLSRSLLAGAIQPARHLTIALAGAASGAAALPTKSIVSDLLEAIETSRTSPRRDAARRAGNGGWWWLNVEGVMLLLRVIQAVRGRKLPAAAAAKRPRGEASDAAAGLRGGGIIGGGGGAARRWCGGRAKKMGNTVGACGSS